MRIAPFHQGAWIRPWASRERESLRAARHPACSMPARAMASCCPERWIVSWQCTQAARRSVRIARDRFRRGTLGRAKFAISRQPRRNRAASPCD
jgi:hypothetical protein